MCIIVLDAEMRPATAAAIGEKLVRRYDFTEQDVRIRWLICTKSNELISAAQVGIKCDKTIHCYR